MTLEQKLRLVETLCYTDHSGVVWRLPAQARGQAEQLLRENPGLTLPDLLPRVTLDQSLQLPAL